MLTIKLNSFEEFASENLGFGTLAGAGTVQVEILLVYSLFLLFLKAEIPYFHYYVSFYALTLFWNQSISEILEIISHERWQIRLTVLCHASRAILN